MDRRINFLYIIPLGLALITFFLTEQILLTTLAVVAGMVILYGLRSRLMPPHVYQAAQLYKRGDLDGALTRVNQALVARPDSWEAYYVRALIHFAAPDHIAAEADARKAIELKPDAATNHSILGQVLFWQERFDEALTAFERAAELNARDPLNHFYVGATLFQLGEFARALPRLELATAMKIGNPQLTMLAFYYLGVSLEAEGHIDDAQPAFRELEKLEKELPRLQEDLRRAPDSPALPRMKRDARGIEKRLKSTAKS
jgi:tetratricopeptide (TPR) repeat protein